MTSDEAHERLVRETRLSDQIAELQEALDASQCPKPALAYLFTDTQLLVLIDQLRELRARRVAMGRDPDDEVNAAADMCTCDPAADLVWSRRIKAAYEGCPRHPRSALRPQLPRLPEDAPQILDGVAAGTLARNDGRAKCGLHLDACPYDAPDLESCSGCNYEPAEGA